MLLLDRQFRRGFEQDCRLCSTEEHRAKRAEWGCDAPLDEPWDSLDCWACEGEPRFMPHCRVCNGTGSLPLTWCPWRYAGLIEREIVAAFCAAQQGQPIARSYAEAPAPLLDAFDLIAPHYTEAMKAAHDG